MLSDIRDLMNSRNELNSWKNVDTDLNADISYEVQSSNGHSDGRWWQH